jgi:hypothetical protein
MPKIDLDDEREIWRSIGQCLNEGDLVLSPFEQPIEEERRVDADQVDDDSNFLGGDNLCISIEPSLPLGKKAIARINPEYYRCKFFLDGSIRTKYVGEYVEGNLSFPVIVSEIAVSVVERTENKFKPARLEKRLYFVFPHKDSGLISDTTYSRLQRIQEELIKRSSFSHVEFLKKAEIKHDIRSSLLGKVRSIMHDMEHEVATKLNRDKGDWLIMDGAIRKQEFLRLENTIGLAKSFSRKPVFSLGNKGPLTLSAYMRNVKDGERSAIFTKNASDSDLKEVIFWYIRIRTFPPMEPLGGIVKIDMKAPESGKLTQEYIRLIDEISSEVYAMRLPTVYPWPRWPSYIYPIRIAEMYMSSSFISGFSLNQIGQEMKNMIGKGV